MLLCVCVCVHVAYNLGFAVSGTFEKKIWISKLKKDSFLDSQSEKNEAIPEQISPDPFQILLSIFFFFVKSFFKPLSNAFCENGMRSIRLEPQIKKLSFKVLYFFFWVNYLTLWSSWAKLRKIKGKRFFRLLCLIFKP